MFDAKRNKFFSNTFTNSLFNFVVKIILLKNIAKTRFGVQRLFFRLGAKPASRRAMPLYDLLTPQLDASQRIAADLSRDAGSYAPDPAVPAQRKSASA